MSQHTQNPQNPQQQLPSPKVLLPVGILLIIFAIAAFLWFDVGVISGIIAVVIGVAGLAMTVQSIMRLAKGER